MMLHDFLATSGASSVKISDRLAAIWLVPPEERLPDARTVSENDEAFHQGLLAATGNAEMARVHRDITEKIRIIRRLDFTKAEVRKITLHMLHAASSASRKAATGA